MVALIGMWYFTYLRNDISIDTFLLLIPLLYLLWQSQLLKKAEYSSEQIIPKEKIKITTKELSIIDNETTNNIENSKVYIDVNYLLGYIQALSINRDLRLEEKLPMRHYTIYNNYNILFDINIEDNTYIILAFIHNPFYIKIEIHNMKDICKYKKIISAIITGED